MNDNEKLLKLVERMSNPLPEYSEKQINRSRVIKLEPRRENLDNYVPLNKNQEINKNDKIVIDYLKSKNPEINQNNITNMLKKRENSTSSLKKNKKNNSKNYYNLNYLFNKNNDNKVTTIPDNYFDNFIKSNSSESENESFNNNIIFQKCKITDFFGNKGDFANNDNTINYKNKSNKLSLGSMDVINQNSNHNLIKDNSLNTANLNNIIKEKDSEISYLQNENAMIIESNNKLVGNYRTTIVNMVLELEAKKKKELNDLIINKKYRLGEIIKTRDGSKFVDSWVDGAEIISIKNRLNEIYSLKESLEQTKKKLQKKSIIPIIDENSNSNANIMLSPFEDKHEYKVNITTQLYFLQKEEQSLKEKLLNLEMEKKELLRIIKLNSEQISSRFCKFNSLFSDSDNYPLIKERYQILSLIGKGGFSEVYKAYDIIDLKDVAVKLHQLNPNWSESTKANYIRHALRENEVHDVLAHPNIVSQIDTIELDSSSFVTILDYCNGPDLSAYLKKNGPMAEKEAKLIIKQILNALLFLNDKNLKVIHYDLKPQNILLDNGLVKITDFGLCKVIDEGESRIEITSQGLGTYWYLPPECFFENSKQKISNKVDIWAVGIIFYELIYGIKPFGNNMSQEKILKEGIILKATNITFPSKPSLSDNCKEFIKGCLKYNQEFRFSVKEAHEFFKKC